MHNTSLTLALWSFGSATSFAKEMPRLGTLVDNSSGYRLVLLVAVGQWKFGFGNFSGQNLLVRVKAGTY